MFAQESGMDLQKEREAFEAWYRKEYDNTVIDDSEFSEILGEYESNYYWVDELNQSWMAWQAAKAQAVPEWISVEDELPTPNKTLSDAVIAWDGLCIRRIPLCLFKSASEVTHWMPIPQPPKAQEPAND